MDREEAKLPSSPSPSKPKTTTLGEIIKLAHSEDRTVHDILGGGTFADLLLWKHAVSSLTLIFLASTIRIMLQSIIEECFLAKLVIGLNIYAISRALLLILVFLHYLPNIGHYLHKKMSCTLSDFTNKLMTIFKDSWIGNKMGKAIVVVSEGIQHIGNMISSNTSKEEEPSEEKNTTPKKDVEEYASETMDALISWVRELLHNIEISSGFFHEVVQMLVTISYGTPFIWALVYLEFFVLAVFFYNPISVLHTGYLLIATIPAIYATIFLEEKKYGNRRS